MLYGLFYINISYLGNDAAEAQTMNFQAGIGRALRTAAASTISSCLSRLSFTWKWYDRIEMVQPDATKQ